MNQPLTIALVTTLCVALTASAAGKPSPAVNQILDKAVARVRANRKEFEKANKKPFDEARVELQELAKKLVDDGKADEAAAVLAQVKTLDTDVMKMADAIASLPARAGKTPPQKPLLERMAGTWRADGQDLSIRTDGTAQQAKGDRGRLKLLSPDVAELNWDGGWKWNIRIVNEDMLAVKEWDSKGKPSDGVVLERIK